MPRSTRKRKQKRGKSKRQRGGVRKLFTVYTLAVGNPMFHEITVAWTNTVLNNILRCIPESYTDIHIIHYEPADKVDPAYTRQITDMERTKPRVRETQFIPEAANIEFIQEIHSDEKDYIIFSFTESIKPTKHVAEKEFLYIDYEGYMGFKNGQRGVIDRSKTYRGLNAIGFDMYGADLLYTEFEPYKFFNVEPDGTVVTLLQQAGRMGCLNHITSLRHSPADFGFGFYLFRMFDLSVHSKIKEIVKETYNNAEYRRGGADEMMQELERAFKGDIISMILNYINEDIWGEHPMTCERFDRQFKGELRTLMS